MVWQQDEEECRTTSDRQRLRRQLGGVAVASIVAILLTVWISHVYFKPGRKRIPLGTRVRDQRSSLSRGTCEGVHSVAFRPHRK